MPTSTGPSTCSDSKDCVRIIHTSGSTALPRSQPASQPDRQTDRQTARQTGRQQEGAEEHRANCLHHRARISAKRRERAPANSAPSRAPSVGQHGTASPPHARRPARLPARQCAGRPGVLGPQSQRPPLPQPRRQPSSAGPAQQCWPVGQAPQPPREPQRAPPNKPLFFFHPRRAWECTMQVARERRSYNTVRGRWTCGRTIRILYIGSYSY